jgi:hypothetical protein
VGKILGEDHAGNARCAFRPADVHTSDTRMGSFRPNHRAVENAWPGNILHKLSKPSHHLNAVFTNVALSKGMMIMHGFGPFRGGLR